MMKIDGVTASTARKTLELKTCEGGERFLHLPLSALCKSRAFSGERNRSFDLDFTLFKVL